MDAQVQSAYSTDASMHHVYMEQLYQGLPVSNGVAGVHLDKDGNIFYISHSFYKPKPAAKKSFLARLLSFQGSEEPSHVSTEPRLSRTEALDSFANYLGLPVHELDEVDDKHVILNDYPKVPTTLKMMQTEMGMKLVWDVALDLDTNWFNAQIDAQTGEVLGLVDWVSHAKFNVFPVGYNDPRDGTISRVSYS